MELIFGFVMLVIAVVFIYFLESTTEKTVQFIYGKDAKNYLNNRKRKNYYGYNAYCYVIRILLFISFAAILLFIFLSFIATKTDIIFLILCVSVTILIFAIWAFLARKKRREHPELEPDADVSASEVSSDATKAETQNEMNSVWSEAPYRMTDKEREEFLKERNHLDENI